MPELVKLESLITSVSVRGYQVTTDQYGSAGAHPIVDQGKALVCGYTDALTLPCRLPVTIFGDHTREVKFINFPFVVGADGTKVLEPSGNQDRRYLSALIELAADRISNLGYARHFKELKEAEVPYVADLSEQRRIAAVLDTWDDAIATAERLLSLRSRQIVGIGERLFSAGFKPEPPSGWSRVRLADVFTERDERGGGGRLLSVTAEQGIIDREEVGRKDISTEDKSAYKRIYPGDIGYNTMRMWQGVSALSRLEGLISPAYTVVTPCKRINGLFAAYLFKQPRMVDRFWRYSQGLVDDTLNLKFPHFAQIAVNLPSIQYQQESASLLNDLSEAAGEERRRMALLRRQKRGLMQKLLTGEWRVPATGDAFVPGGPAADRLEAAE